MKNPIKKIYNQNKNSVKDEIGEPIVCLHVLWIQTADKRAFEEVNAKFDKILGQLQWLVVVLSFEDG